MSGQVSATSFVRIVLGIVASAALSLTVTQVADASAPVRGATTVTTPAIIQCYTNLSHATGNAVISQNFEEAFAADDAAGATAVTLDKPCKVAKVVVHGIFVQGYGDGPASSEDVTFFTNAGGLPGTVVRNGYQPNLGGTETDATFSIVLTHTVKLKAGTYWLSVVVNMSEEDGGLWAWNIDTYDAKHEAAWENPAGGWGRGCESWETISQCGVGNSGRSLEAELWRSPPTDR